MKIYICVDPSNCPSFNRVIHRPHIFIMHPARKSPFFHPSVHPSIFPSVELFIQPIHPPTCTSILYLPLIHQCIQSAISASIHSFIHAYINHLFIIYSSSMSFIHPLAHLATHTSNLRGHFIYLYSHISMYASSITNYSSNMAFVHPFIHLSIIHSFNHSCKACPSNQSFSSLAIYIDSHIHPFIHCSIRIVRCTK